MDILGPLPGVALSALMFYFGFWRPLRRVRSARSWRETPCVIVSSAVNEDAGDSGLYYIDLTYEYGFGKRQHRSSRYSFSPASTAGPWGKRLVVRRLAPGTTATCYVNPDDPSDAVINRGMTWDMILMGAFAMVIFGVIVFVFLFTRIVRVN
jgi:hypothetical protein